MIGQIITKISFIPFIPFILIFFFFFEEIEQNCTYILGGISKRTDAYREGDRV
jgi:hypothetical protein